MIPVSDTYRVLGAAYAAKGYWSGVSLHRELRRRAELHPETRMTFIQPAAAVEVTAADAVQRADRLAAALHARGWRPGDVLALQVPHSPENLYAILAGLRLGLQLVPIVPIYGAAELGFILRQTRARGLVAPTRWRGGDFALKLANAGELPDLQEVLATDDGPNIPRGRLLAEDLLSRAPGAPVFDDPEAPAMIVFTSGSTAEPKGVVHSQRTFECELRSLGTLYRNGWRGGFLNALPAGHVAGMLGALRGLYHGLDCVYTEAWNPEEARELLERFQLTWSMGAPFHLAGLIEASAGRGLSSLRAYLVGAAPVPEEMVARADKLGFAAFRSYGSSELPSLSCGAPWESLSERANSDGALMDGVEVRLVDDEGRAVAEGEPGEILARAPELFIGYTVPSLTAEAVTDDGFFRTGDVGVLRNGRLTIVDRKKDIIIRGGENIASREVEDILLTHPAVAEAAAIGRPDPTYGEKVAAFLKLRPGTDLDLEAVRAHFAAAGTARQKTPESIHIVDDLPRTPSGKVRKPELRARFTNPSV